MQGVEEGGLGASPVPPSGVHQVIDNHGALGVVPHPLHHLLSIQHLTHTVEYSQVKPMDLLRRWHLIDLPAEVRKVLGEEELGVVGVVERGREGEYGGDQVPSGKQLLGVTSNFWLAEVEISDIQRTKYPDMLTQ